MTFETAGTKLLGRPALSGGKVAHTRQAIDDESFHSVAAERFLFAKYACPALREGARHETNDSPVELTAGGARYTSANQPVERQVLPDWVGHDVEQDRGAGRAQRRIRDSQPLTGYAGEIVYYSTNE